MQNNILVLNSGSSSIKFAIYNESDDTPICYGLIDNIASGQTQLTFKQGQHRETLSLAGKDYQACMQALLDHLQKQTDNLLSTIAAVGHRVVHGGEALTKPSLITPETLAAIEQCTQLAPLHNPANLLGIRTLQSLMPDTPQVAVFDTAFHQSLPELAYRYPLPRALCDDYAIRKYGFHGTSYDYVSQQAGLKLGKPRNQCNLIIAHLGNGASLCAIKNGVSVDTSMGMTPLAGIMMGTRCGNIDPGIIPYLCNETGQSLDQVMTILTKKSGLLGLSGLSHDMRELCKAVDNPNAALALKIFAYQIAQTIASYRVPLPHLDAVVFTGGIGENNPQLRQDVIGQLSFLGLTLDHEANQQHGRDQNGLISSKNSVKVFVIQTNEEYQIAELTRAETQRRHG